MSAAEMFEHSLILDDIEHAIDGLNVALEIFDSWGYFEDETVCVREALEFLNHRKEKIEAELATEQKQDDDFIWHQHLREI